MPASPAPAIDSDLLTELFQQGTVEGRAALLQAAQLLHEDGLSHLLDEAMKLARHDPGRARHLTRICAEMADGYTAAPAIVPRARYIQAQTHAFNGEFGEALRLIELAHDEYEALGSEPQALRTNAGRMHVLTELGRYQDALAVGADTLQGLELLQETSPAAAGQAEMIAALVHHNRGVCCRRLGRYEEALRSFDVTENYYLSHDMTEQMGDIRSNRGLILLNLGRVNDALAAFEASAEIAAKVGRTLLQVEALINASEAYLLLGNYTQSLESLAQAGTLLAKVDAPTNGHFVLLHRADVYQALNLYPEALADYRQAATAFREAEMAHYQGRALWGMGVALVAQGQFEEAEETLARAAALFQETENVPLLSSVCLEQAALRTARGDKEAAIQTAQEALDLVVGHDWPVQQAYALLRLADLALPDTALAESYLVRARYLTQSLVFPQLHYRLIQRLGHIRLLQGQYGEAQELLEAAVEDIERMRGTVAQEAMRISFLHDKMVAYEDLLQIYLEKGDLRGAFLVAEQAKSRVLVDLLVGVISPTMPENADVSGRLQTLYAELNAVYNEFLGNVRQTDGAQAEVYTPAARTELLRRAHQLERTIRRLHLETNTGGINGDPFQALPLAQIEASLPDDLILVSYHALGDEIMAFVVWEGQVKVFRKLSSLKAVQRFLQRLSVQFDRFRAGRAFVQRHLPLLEQSARRILYTLYEELVAPLPQLTERGSREKPQKVTIVPHGLLHQVPFHALFDGEQYLLERLEIAYAPSVTVLALCEAREFQPPARSFVAGVSDPLIPAVKAEVAVVARHLPQAEIQVDAQATVETVIEKAAGCDILHLACHGLFRTDNPMFSALKLYNGWLTAVAAMQLRLNNALVTLSACESGLSHVMAGDEVIGLTRAFLGVGAATLVVSLWLVQDESTVALMAEWYNLLQQKSYRGRASSLREAQLSLKENFSHPYYWAPFVLVGQR